VYSVWHPDVDKHTALSSKVNHYVFIKTNGWWDKLKKYVFRKKNSHIYYHYSIEFFLSEVIKDIRKKHFDTIILENRPAYSLKLKTETNAKIIYHLHNDNLNKSVPQAHALYNNADHIITVSDYIKERVQTIMPQDTKTITILNGINLAMFAPLADENRKQHDDFLMVFSGRLIPEKGILQLIKAMQQLKTYSDIKLVIIGSGSLGNNQSPTHFQEQLKEASQDLDNIHFTGYITYKEMAHYLQKADIAVLPSIWEEPFGLTVAEGMAAGLPIITTHRGGIPEMVTDRNAIVIPTDGDFTGHLANAIRSLYHDQEGRRKMGEVSKQLSGNYSKELYAKHFLDAIAVTIQR
jgi:glycosyltransferase involved in cell wall biosynthesis